MPNPGSANVSALQNRGPTNSPPAVDGTDVRSPEKPMQEMAAP
jgi:hypothetical protein